MKKKITLIASAIAVSLVLFGCGVDSPKINDTTKEAIEDLNAAQQNFANGVSMLNEIPVVFVEEIYNNFDEIHDSGIEGAPIMLREYAVTNTVYFDYSDDVSVVWDKNTDSVTLEYTNTTERDEFAMKQHK